MHDLMLLYMFLIKLKHFPVILAFISLCHRPDRQTVSNACLRSTNAQNSFFLCVRNISSKLCNTKILSAVENPFLKPV